MGGISLFGALFLLAIPTSADVETYRAAAERVGHDAEGHVDLALWCEAHGLSSEKQTHLARAILIDPQNPRARGLLGKVGIDGKWLPPKDVPKVVSSDHDLAAVRAQYVEKREELYRHDADTRREAAAHVKLGLWCEENGLKPEATAHFTKAVVLSPTNETAWKHLGCVKHNGRWLNPEQLAAERRLTEARRSGMEKWVPLFRRWRAELNDPKLQEQALRQLESVTDPFAARAVTRVFRTRQNHDEMMAVKLLRQIDDHESTRELASFAIAGESKLVRNVATQVLRTRAPDDFAALLIELIHSPITYRVQPVRGLGSVGLLELDTARFHALIVYDVPDPLELARRMGYYVGYDANGLPVVAKPGELERLEADAFDPKKFFVDLSNIKSNLDTETFFAKGQLERAQNRLYNDIVIIEHVNVWNGIVNERVEAVLRATVGGPSQSHDEIAWRSWWSDRLGYSYAPKKASLLLNGLWHGQRSSCFPTGTPVRTLNGDRPIESLRVGDKVLSQDTRTGTLAFKPVLVLHDNGPSPTLRLRFQEGETLIASIYHRFWRAGRGWALARDLVPGDVIRTLGGCVTLTSATKDAVVRVYNLDVDEFRTYFVGHSALLVHDNRLPGPGIMPFDAAPEPELVTARSKSSAGPVPNETALPVDPIENKSQE